MVKSKTLIFIAGIVWMIAGLNILKIGILSYIGHINIMRILLSIVIFLLFWLLVFKKLVKKHTNRIKGYGNEKKYIWNFFDIPAFLIMSFMITIGVTIRAFHILPDPIIAFFYTGLGVALSCAGINFIKNFIYYVK